MKDEDEVIDQEPLAHEAPQQLQMIKGVEYLRENPRARALIGAATCSSVACAVTTTAFKCMGYATAAAVIQGAAAAAASCCFGGIFCCLLCRCNPCSCRSGKSENEGGAIYDQGQPKYVP